MIVPILILAFVAVTYAKSSSTVNLNPTTTLQSTSTAPTGGVNWVIDNQHPANISLFYANGSGVAPLTSPQLIVSGNTSTATFPAGWQGNIQVVEAGRGGDYSQASWMVSTRTEGHAESSAPVLMGVI